MESLNELKRDVARWTKGLNRHYDKMDAIEEWNDKSKYQCSMMFVGARDVLISVQSKYIEALEQRLATTDQPTGSASSVTGGEGK